MMRLLRVALHGVVAGLAVVGIFSMLMLLMPRSPRYTYGTRHYKLLYAGNVQSIRADRIDRRDGCVIFYREDRIDTILCETLGTLVVTEVAD